MQQKVWNRIYYNTPMFRFKNMFLINSDFSADALQIYIKISM